MEKSPCFLRNPCQDRCPGCHSTCEAYKAWEEKHRAERETMQRAKYSESMITRAEVARSTRGRMKRKK